MAPVPLPHIQLYRVGSRMFAYYRRRGRRVRIGALPCDSNFAAAYEAARLTWGSRQTIDEGDINRKRGPLAAPVLGTLAALVAIYKAAPEFLNLAPTTRRDYGAVLDMLMTRFGTVAVDRCHRAWVLRMRDEVQEKPRTANYRVAIIRRLMSFAVDRGLRQDNPALRVGILGSAQEHRIWTQAEIAAMTSPIAGDIALPVLLGLYTAQRRGDLLRLPWLAYDGTAIRLRQSKGAKLKDNARVMVLPVPAELKAALDATPRRGPTICVTATGKPWKEDHFAHRFAETRAALGLADDLHFHGLRHTRLTLLAEAGATEAELMATGGHKTSAMVSRYTKQAGQEGLARKGAERLAKHVTNAKVSSRLRKFTTQNV
jgi:integrase